MTALVAFLLALILWLIAAIHAAWGVGISWPAKDERSLARMVVGSKGIERMPSALACHVVAAALAVAGALPLMFAGFFPSPWPNVLTMLGLSLFAIVFIGRGMVAYVPWFRKFGPEEPFATYDKRLYAPLCLILGAGLVFLLTR